MNKHSAIIKNSWNQWSETWYQRYRTDAAISKIIESPESAFHHKTYSMVKKALSNVHNKRICVPSSGDNHAVFAFHLMGAKVTSCDISEKQLENSSEIARKHGWDIEFICDDTMELSKIKSDEYDFVYTSNGVHVWINDLNSMYNNIHRILKTNGSYIMMDIHPFMRPFGINAAKEINVVKPYDSTGPFGEVPTFKWRIQDIMNAMISSGLDIKQIEEMFAEDGTFWVDESKDDVDTLSKQELDEFCNWQSNPLAALPQWLSIHAIK
ncbi:methyltransferase domain-containing protein [Paenibacillus sp. LMG 31456]|uniref:Methyltransferase domain-containing protein n=1 Tax=Paenibacillus foliorum TaxID=2654974 RepID=A0A972GTK0_9BACL|nr:class I SAM-dependent methyltransferase [Paenibacillus foliorum]NOU96611.1 methyltransferase domain-containing protein [Paenibacillus foliorum]